MKFQSLGPLFFLGASGGLKNYMWKNIGSHVKFSPKNYKTCRNKIPLQNISKNSPILMNILKIFIKFIEYLKDIYITIQPSKNYRFAACSLEKIHGVSPNYCSLCCLVLGEKPFSTSMPKVAIYVEECAIACFIASNISQMI